MNTFLLPIVGLVAFAIAAACGRPVIRWLHKLKFGQTILEDGPKWHEKKQGTPTMGGVLFIGGFALALLMAVAMLLLSGDALAFGTPYETARFWGGFGLAVGCGLIGFADDFIKVVKKQNLGLTPLQKILFQLIVSGSYAFLLYKYGNGRLNIPFFGEAEWGVWFIPFCMFVIIAMSNAANLTDGVDGLCGSTGFIAALALLLLAGLEGQMPQAVTAAALAGGLAGFLLWNLHPAKVFMGDTGSLFIGGALTAVAFGIEQPFLLVPVAVLYIAENLSVILQVGYFKLTHGKRLFKMSPLHHHFEMCGWSENKIVIVFSAVTALGCLTAIGLWFLTAY